MQFFFFLALVRLFKAEPPSVLTHSQYICHGSGGWRTERPLEAAEEKPEPHSLKVDAEYQYHIF